MEKIKNETENKRFLMETPTCMDEKESIDALAYRVAVVLKKRGYDDITDVDNSLFFSFVDQEKREFAPEEYTRTYTKMQQSPLYEYVEKYMSKKKLF